MRVVTHQQPMAAVPSTNGFANPSTEREPDFPVLFRVKIERVFVADLAKQPGVKGDEF